MYYKLCPQCHRRSFSAANKGLWICPYCEADLTLEKAQAGDSVFEHSKLIPFPVQRRTRKTHDKKW